MTGASQPSRAPDDGEKARAAHRRSRPERDDPFAHLDLDQAELRAVHDAVYERVRRSFRGSLNEHDIEDAVSEAWEGLLKEELSTPVRDRRAFAAEVGWRAARAINRRARPMPFDPLDSPVLEQEDLSPSPIEQIDDRARAARLAEALEQLDEDKRAAFHLRFIEDLAHDEACERLGLKRTAYFDRIKAAKARVEAAVGLRCHVFKRRERQLLSDYVAGIAVGRARVRAERLIAADPRAAALARELRRSHEQAALVLPTLTFAEVFDQDVGGRFAGLLDRAHETVTGWLGRGPDPGELASSPALGAGGARGAGAAGAGLVAKALGGVGAGKVALGCLSGGAVATIACVATGVLPLPGQGVEGEAAPTGHQAQRIGPAERAGHRARVADLVEARPTEPTPTRSSSTRPEPDTAEPATAPEPASTLESDVAPEVEEFGVAGAGTPVGGAPPDTNDSDGASAASVRQEFGP